MSKPRTGPDGGGRQRSPAPDAPPPELDLVAVRERLAHARGPEYWRSLDELAQSAAFTELLEREFPRQAAEWDPGLSRRRFLQLMGASLALAGLTSCRQQSIERIVPYHQQPEEIVPGQPLFFATATTLGGYGTGLLVESHMGRPTKVEGNPQHPASLGAAGALAQASILTLYDPDRSQALTHLEEVQTWQSFRAALGTVMRAHRAMHGAGLRLLTGTVTSPTLAAQLDLLLRRLPEARWHQYEPAGPTNPWNGARAVFGQPLETRYDLSRATIIVTLDADLLGSGPGHLRYAREFAERRRRARSGGSGGSGDTGDTGGSGDAAAPMSRLYAIESTPSVTGSAADHRLPLPPSAIETLALALAAAARVPGIPAPATERLPAAARHWVEVVARDLARHRGHGLVVAGESAPAEVHALAHALNGALGNLGRTVIVTDPVAARPTDQLASIAELTREMRDGKVDTLVIAGCNPVYDAPADLDFAAALRKVSQRVHLGLYADETAEHCHWHLPAAHELEGWSDCRAHDGTASVIQPLIEPLYDGRTAHQLVAAMLAAGPQEPLPADYDLVRDTWRAWHAGHGASGNGNPDFEAAWRRWLHDGLISGSALPARRPGVNLDAARAAARRLAARAESAAAAGGSAADHAAAPLELCLRPDPSLHDGRFANNGWLQELPRPWTRLTWDNALLVSPALAERRGLRNEDVVELRAGERTLEAPVWILPGHPDGAATLHLGYGRRRAGRVADGAGVDAYRLRTAAAAWNLRGVELRPTGRRYALACTQDHHSMEGRRLVRSASLEHYRRHPRFAHQGGHGGSGGGGHGGGSGGGGEPAPAPSLYPGFSYDGYAWGLAVDLGACIGCNACVVACQAENNVPVVGKDQVGRAREMHWLRIDRYFSGDLEQPDIANQPVMCMQCENAPCEVVCPVAATVHSSEGLNDMVYNRCVGTRYCSNNCPYKVRRFNFLQYSDMETPSLRLGRNPDVTVRTRGVMEKCTYCVQRISHARITAKREGRRIADGEIVTACQQACPTRAIVFGDLNDPGSEVARLKAENLNYTLIEEINVKPRTSYLARLRNPNPELAGAPEELES